MLPIHMLGRRGRLLPGVRQNVSNVLAIFYLGMCVAGAFKWERVVDMRPNPSGIDPVTQCPPSTLAVLEVSAKDDQSSL
jgi:hypothetical protein